MLFWRREGVCTSQSERSESPFRRLYSALIGYDAIGHCCVKAVPFFRFQVKWMMYWIVFALFTCAETFTDVFFSFWFPFYYEIKTILVIWLLSPATKGSSILYRRFVHPALIRRETEIDEALARATEQGYTAVLHLGSKGVNYATTVLMQTAIKLVSKLDPTVLYILHGSQSVSAISSSAKYQPTSTPKTELELRTAVTTAITETSSSRRSSIDYEDFDLEAEEASLVENASKVMSSSADEDTFKLPDKRKRYRHTTRGGGGLVQHLKKSYSLSDLTGEKEDENRNTSHMHDETDMAVEPRRRENVGRRGYSPRRTQSSSNRVEMYFSEVDVDVRQPMSREPTASLTNIRSSDDISSGYSSGEALQSSRSSQADPLVRTASVGARTRAKPRSTMKKTPEDAGEDSDSNDLPSSKHITIPTPLSHVTPEQALEILLLLAQNSNVADYIRFDRGSFVAGNDDSVGNTSQSGPEPEGAKAETIESKGDSSDPALATEIQIIQSIEVTTVPERSVIMENSVDDRPVSQTESQENKVESVANVSTSNEQPHSADPEEAERTITDELCQTKFDELKQLLSEAHKAVNNIVYTQEKLKGSNASIAESLSRNDASQNVETNESIKKDDSEEAPGEIEQPKESNNAAKVEAENDNVATLDVWTTPDVSRSNSDSLSSRAGKYNKKPAPKAPLTKSEEDLNETDSQNALKATLVIKTGTLKTFSNTGTTKDVFIAHVAEKSKGKKSKRQRTKEGFSKLLTIPKNIFHNAFNREHKGSTKTEDSASSDISAPESRSNSIEPQETIIELSPKMSISSQDTNTETDDKSENDTSIGSDSFVLAEATNQAEKEKIATNEAEKETNDDIPTKNPQSEIREMSQSPRAGKKLESDIY
ncbi:Receptor expression-enhancing protein 1 [Dufourea novaeangliae]|uniref:Receptor expression-enhancing protein 1 n=1 Tax=Dufourea novaeangliae TaxID=178035 RepID=A0A154P775_DUFNO|nr:Receptor expression-enhancing protein 1 [Dufourea novaeangliae]